ncbi:MAG: hypothetical protein OEZ02_09665 [Anaerolineae bacterium]|nr:hypothetical protein [Anaerolineae bacterium]
MKIVIDEKQIAKFAKTGLWASIAGLVFMMAAMIIMFNFEQQFGLSLIFMAIGFFISQIGTYYTNHWGRRPRPDEELTKVLKGLDNHYTLYHYQSPARHLLVGPAGLWAILPRNSRGRISYDERRKRWRQHGGSMYGKLFGQEGLGRPDLEIAGEIAAVEKFLTKNFGAGNSPTVHGMLVFTPEATKVDAQNAPVATLHLGKLREFFRRQAKDNRLDNEVIRQVKDRLEAGKSK